MWLLKNDAGKLYYIRGDKITTVGRKKTDIILSDDTSISKSHAAFQVQRTQDGSKLVVKDIDSKYGTFILSENNINIKGSQYELKHSDKIRFGLQEHLFRVYNVPIKICISQINDKDKAELENIAGILDAVVSNKWKPDCTHLTTSKPTLTSKVVQALILNLPIVDLMYWREVLRAIQNNDEFPNTQRFILEMKDDSLSNDVTLLPQKERRDLFKNLTFVSFSKRQFKNYLDIIEAAGGKFILYNIHDENKNMNFTGDNVIVLQLTTEGTQYNDDLSMEYVAVSNILNRKNRRVISETEIPLAVLYCSTKQHCNPSYDFRQLLTKNNPKKQSIQNSFILAQDTQDVVTKNKPIKKQSTQSLNIIKESPDIPSSESLYESQIIYSNSRPCKTEPCSPVQDGSKEANDNIQTIITEPVKVTTAMSSSGTSQNSNKSAYYSLNTDNMKNSNWKNNQISTQKNEDVSLRSLQVECSTDNNRELDSLFTNSDEHCVSTWQKISETQKSMEIQNDATKKRKREDDVDEISTIETQSKKCNEKCTNLLNKKQKTDLSVITKQKDAKSEEMMIFDDWELDEGLEVGNDSGVNVKKFNFILNNKEVSKSRSGDCLEIRIEKKRVPPKNLEKEQQLRIKSATTSKSEIGTNQVTNTEKQHKRIASRSLSNDNPEKKRKLCGSRNDHSVEQITRNIENITVDQDDFIIMTGTNFCANTDESQPILRDNYESALEKEIFIKDFKKSFKQPIEIYAMNSP